MDERVGMFDFVGMTYEPVFTSPDPTLPPGAAYSSLTPVSANAPASIPIEATSPTSTSSPSYLPRPPHIAIPTSSQSVSEAADNRLDTGVIVGIVFGALAFLFASGAIMLYLCHRKCSSTRKQQSRGSWTDFERKNDTSDFDSLPSYDQVKAPGLCASAHYTKYVPRTLGRLSPVSKTVPPTFDLIKDHHLASDLSMTDPKVSPTRNGAYQIISPDYLNDIELTVTPFNTRFEQ